jgi:phosphatidylserine/phosphatidylglycerophosphate/cardiolipin synthase-like enzyme
MLSSRRVFSLLLFAVFALGTILFSAHKNTPSSTAPVSILGANTDLQLFTQPQAGHEPIVSAIDKAQKEVLVEVYLLSDKQIIASLEQDSARGIDVKVMLEQHPFGGGNLNQKTKSELASKGVAVTWTNPAFALTHEKTVIIDGSQVFILNQNLTASAFMKNREYDVLDSNSQDVNEVRTIFLDDWQQQTYTPHDSHLVVSPVTSRAGLTALITGATKSIEIEMEDIADPSIENLLAEKAKQMPVEVILPTLSQLSGNADAIKILSQGGVTVKTMSSPYIHAKLIVVDDIEAYVGSVNLSTQSMDKNRELGIIVKQPEAIQQLEQTFQQDWMSAKELL